MEPFEIEVGELTYLVKPQEYGSFDIYEGDMMIGSVFPELDVNGTVWRSLDLITRENVEKIGEEIEMFEM
jgi:hypothetical protein